MLVRDHTPVYSPLGKYAGRRMEHYGDWMDVLQSGIEATGTTIGAIAGAAATAAKQQPTVQTVQPGVSQLQNRPPQQPPPKSWYQDPLTLAAIGLGVVGIGVVVFSSRRRGAMAGFGSYRRRRARRHGRR